MARPRAATFDQQRDAMLAAAAELFAERGYATASIADLARACGVSKGLLYHYYRDKEHLLFDIADRYMDTLRAIVEPGTGNGKADPAAHLRTLIGRFMFAYRDSAARHRVLVQDVKYLSPRHRNRIRTKQRAVVDGLADAIAQVAPQPGPQQGAQRANRAARSAMLKPLTMTLFGMMNWTFTWLRDDGALSYEDMASLVADLFLSGVGGVHEPRRNGVPRLRLRTSGRAAPPAVRSTDRAQRPQETPA